MATALEIRDSAAARPKVLFVSHETTLTGAPIELLHLVRWLQKEGWDLLVATPESGPISDLLAADGIPLVIHPGLLLEPGHAKLRELAAQCDIVVANTIISWAAVRAAHLEGKRVIWYLHETLVAVRLIRQIPEIGPTLELATLIVTPTRQTARILEGMTHTPIEVVPYGIPAVQAAGQGAADARVTFVTAASLEPRKGQDILVAAIKALPAAIREAASFKVVGRHLDRPFVEKVKESAAGFGNIEFTGERSHAQSLELLAASDSLICPSRDETMPITILEAMSLGKVIISADVGGIAEWLRDEMNGLLVPREDSGSFGARHRAMHRRSATRRATGSGRATNF